MPGVSMEVRVWEWMRAYWMEDDEAFPRLHFFKRICTKVKSYHTEFKGHEFDIHTFSHSVGRSLFSIY